MKQVEVILFNILHMFIHCDFDISEKEEKLINDAMKELSDSERLIVNSEIEKNVQIVSEGFPAMSSRTLEMGKLINDMDGSEEIKYSFLEVIKIMIKIDGIIHENEKKMFDSLCDLWDVKSKLNI